MAADAWPRTKEDARDKAAVVYALGIKQVIVLVSRMDVIEKESQASHFEMLKNQLGSMFKSLGFSIIQRPEQFTKNDDDDKKACKLSVVIMPANGQEGGNLMSLDEDMNFWGKSRGAIPLTFCLWSALMCPPPALFLFNRNRFHVPGLSASFNNELHKEASGQTPPRDDL